jgi:hypothetical protein
MPYRGFHLIDIWLFFLLIWRRGRDYSGLRPRPSGRRRYATTFSAAFSRSVEPSVFFLYFNRLLSHAVTMLLDFECFSAPQPINDNGKPHQGSFTTEIGSGA